MPTVDGESSQTSAKLQTKQRQTPSTTSQVLSQTSDPLPIPPNHEKSFVSSTTTGGIRRPTIIPAPSSAKTTNNSIKKTAVTPLTTVTHPQLPTSMTNSTTSIPELPSSPVPTVAKRNAIPTRSISNVAQSPIISNLRSSPSNNQPSTSSIPTVPSTTGNSLTRGGGIPRLTKNPHQIIKPTTTTAGPAKRSGQVNHLSYYLYGILIHRHAVNSHRLSSMSNIVSFS